MPDSLAFPAAGCLVCHDDVLRGLLRAATDLGIDVFRQLTRRNLGGDRGWQNQSGSALAHGPVLRERQPRQSFESLAPGSLKIGEVVLGALSSERDLRRPRLT